MGLAASVGLLKAIEATGRPENVLGVWATVQVCCPTILLSVKLLLAWGKSIFDVRI
jgi:hypothetical protein